MPVSGNRTSADVTKYGEKIRPAFRGDPKSNDCCPYKKRKGHRDTLRKEGHVKTRVMLPMVPGAPGATRKQKRQGQCLSPEPSKGARPG